MYVCVCVEGKMAKKKMFWVSDSVCVVRIEAGVMTRGIGAEDARLFRDIETGGYW